MPSDMRSPKKNNNSTADLNSFRPAFFETCCVFDVVMKLGTSVMNQNRYSTIVSHCFISSGEVAALIFWNTFNHNIVSDCSNKVFTSHNVFVSFGQSESMRKGCQLLSVSVIPAHQEAGHQM